MSAPPSNAYAEWVAWLEAFRRGENPPTDRLPPVEGTLGSYVEARLLDRFSVAVSERTRQWQGALADRIVAQPPRSHPEAAALLRDAVERLDPLLRLARSPLLPRAVSAMMTRNLAEVRDGARAALEDAWRRAQEPVVAVEPAVARLRAPQRRPRAGEPAVPVPRVPGARGGARLVEPALPDPRRR